LERTRTPLQIQKDPEYYANMGRSTLQVREDHQHMPEVAPGITVAIPGVTMELAQVPGISFKGEEQYARFWRFFRAAVGVFSTHARSEVVSVYQVGSTLRVRWRLVLTERMLPLRMEAAHSLRFMQNTLGGLFGVGHAGDSFFSQMERPGERRVDFNSIYELDIWNGRIASHKLEFRTPDEDYGLIRALESSLLLSRNAQPALVHGLEMSEEQTSDNIASIPAAVLIVLFASIGGILAVIRFRRRAPSCGQEPLLAAA
jgi:hypothetical protein